jgi:hypothetical protein
MKSMSPILLTIIIAVVAISAGPKANAQEAGAAGTSAAVQENNASLNLSQGIGAYRGLARTAASGMSRCKSSRMEKS